MPKHKPHKQDAPRELSEQSKLFIEKAREIGADGEASVEDVMRRLVRQPRPSSSDGAASQSKKTRK